MASLYDINSSIELTQILSGNKHDKDYILLDFYSKDCFPCHKIVPILSNFSEKYNNIYFAKINKKNPEFKEIINQHDIKQTPTVLVFKKGNTDILIRSVGSKPFKIQELEEKLTQL